MNSRLMISVSMLIWYWELSSEYWVVSIEKRLCYGLDEDVIYAWNFFHKVRHLSALH